MKKAGRDDLADVERHVESAVQVYANDTYTVDRLDHHTDLLYVDVDTIDVDADSSGLKTLQLDG